MAGNTSFHEILPECLPALSQQRLPLQELKKPTKQQCHFGALLPKWRKTIQASLECN